MSDPKFWMAIEYDQNNPYPRDIVTRDHAEDLEVGQEVIAVCLGHVTVERIGIEFRYLDFGVAARARITKIVPIEKADLCLVTAELIEESK